MSELWATITLQANYAMQPHVKSKSISEKLPQTPTVQHSKWTQIVDRKLHYCLCATRFTVRPDNNPPTMCSWRLLTADGRRPAHIWMRRKPGRENEAVDWLEMLQQQTKEWDKISMKAQGPTRLIRLGSDTRGTSHGLSALYGFSSLFEMLACAGSCISPTFWGDALIYLVSCCWSDD